MFNQSSKSFELSVGHQILVSHFFEVPSMRPILLREILLTVSWTVGDAGM